jgi:hypothetical protein
MTTCASVRVACICVLGFCAASVQADAAGDAKRRVALSDKGKVLFKNTKNHCHAFRDLVSFAIVQTKATGEVLEDLKFVLVGEALTKRGSGPYYIGNTPGARGDSGFKDEIRDGSPQVEHAMAAIYIGKFFPPPAPEAAAALTEFGGKNVNAADVLLWSLGGDAGQRVSDRELDKLPKVIERTMCA